MLADLLLIAVGLGVLIAGGELLVRGASGLARTYGVSQFAIGLSVVAFGTSAPELAVNVLASWTGNGAVSFGNVFGSNVANICLVLATAALIRDIHVKDPVVRREIPMMLLATLVTAILGAEAWLGAGGEGSYGRGDGLVLLAMFGMFIAYTVVDLLKTRAANGLAQSVAQHAPKKASPSKTRGVLMILVGAALLAGGARISVTYAVSAAERLHVPQEIVGLTILAIGTSLPELTTSVLAALRGDTDLAVGNVVGSNIFNLLFVLGVTATVAPVPVPPRGWAELLVAFGVSALLLFMGRSGRRRIVRLEGGVLLSIYAVYLVWRSTI